MKIKFYSCVFYGALKAEIKLYFCVWAFCTWGRRNDVKLQTVWAAPLFEHRMTRYWYRWKANLVTTNVNDKIVRKQVFNHGHKQKPKGSQLSPPHGKGLKHPGEQKGHGSQDPQVSKLLQALDLRCQRLIGDFGLLRGKAWSHTRSKNRGTSEKPTGNTEETLQVKGWSVVVAQVVSWYNVMD